MCWPGFRKGVFQRGAAIAHGIAAHLLGAVQVAQRHVVKGIEQAGIHAVHTAHRDFLALTAGGTGHELMGHQHAAVGRVRRAVAQHAGKGIVVALHGLVRPDMPHHGGLEEGQKVHVQRAVLVGEGDGHRRTGEHRADVHPAVLQQGSAEGDAVGGVVVAADGEHRQLPLSQLGEEPVQQAHGFGRGNGLIVEVARQQHTVHGRAVQQGEDLFQNVPLVVQHGELAHPLAQMQVGKMQKTQTETPPFQSFLYYTAGRGWGQGKLPQSSLRDASPLGDGAFGSAEKLPVLPEAPSLRELARHKP